jgi:hypothetical protein
MEWLFFFVSGIIIGAGALLLVISILAEIQRWKLLLLLLKYQGVSTENTD